MPGMFLCRRLWTTIWNDLHALRELEKPFAASFVQVIASITQIGVILVTVGLSMSARMAKMLAECSSVLAPADPSLSDR